jgi:hypothetical protein
MSDIDRWRDELDELRSENARLQEEHKQMLELAELINETAAHLKTENAKLKEMYLEKWSPLHKALTRELNESVAENAILMNDYQELKKQAYKLLAALESIPEWVEMAVWSYDTDGDIPGYEYKPVQTCPSCFARKSDGHSADCQRQRMKI